MVPADYDCVLVTDVAFGSSRCHNKLSWDIRDRFLIVLLYPCLWPYTQLPQVMKKKIKKTMTEEELKRAFVEAHVETNRMVRDNVVVCRIAYLSGAAISVQIDGVYLDET